MRSNKHLRHLARNLALDAPLPLHELANAVLERDPASGVFIAFDLEFTRWKNREAMERHERRVKRQKERG